MNRRYDFVVLGAYGFTAKTVLTEICLCNTWDSRMSWAIAGRNQQQLREVRQIITVSSGNIPLPDVLVVDVTNYASLLLMAKRTTLLLNCVGPYRKLGEPVVRACLEGKCDYLDLCGEPTFIERMTLLYHDAAKQAGVTICHAAAFDSVPCDLGVLEAKRILKAKNAEPSSVEVFLTLHSPEGIGFHYTTYEAAIQGFGENPSTRKQIRRELEKKFGPRRLPIGPPVFSKKGWFGISRDSRVQGWVIPNFFSDPAVVRLSQLCDASVPPVHFSAYITVPSFHLLLVIIPSLIVFQLLARFRVGRLLLLTYPRFFTLGMVSRQGPTAKQLELTSFTQTFFANGYSPSSLARLSEPSKTSPDTFLCAKITGPEPGYTATPVIFVKCARTILEERTKVAKGVLTPSGAFTECKILAELATDGRVVWTLQRV